jgi:dTDP-4-amino-4,6-dideoxygalactose transaminase
MLRYPEAEKHNYQYIVVEIDPLETGIDRDRLVRVLHAENILARSYFYPGCHMADPYRTEQPEAGNTLPNTNALVERVMTLPTGTAVGAREIREICALIALAAGNGKAITMRMQKLESQALAVSLAERRATGAEPVRLPSIRPVEAAPGD